MDQKLININERLVAEYVKMNRPPIEIRDKLDLGYSYIDGVVELFEIRPDFMNQKVYFNSSFAKIKHIKSKNIWKLYWMRASGKWEAYPPLPEANSIRELLDCIKDDNLGCFRG